jgi:hypothetical protein
VAETGTPGPSTPAAGSSKLPSSDLARTLTQNEATVVSSLLGASQEGVERQIRRSGVPRSSYREAKRRLLSRGLLEPRILPHPALLGTVRVSFLVTRPHADEIAPTVQALADLPEVVTLWSGHQLVFAVVYHGNPSAAETFERRVMRGAFGAPLVHISTDPQIPQVPVFFDFEGAWNRFTGLSGTSGYPRPMLGADPLAPRLPVGPRREADLRRMLAPVRSEPGAEEGASTLEASGLPRAQRRWIEAGAVDWRVLLRPELSPSFQGATISNVIFVQGRLQLSGALLPLFRDLAQNCGVSPFVLASDGDKVLLVSLGAGTSSGRDGGPSRPPRSSVRAVLLRHLVSFDSLREPTPSLKVHRYLDFAGVAPR